ncbi:complex I NDUFA9 subunit family protein [Roseomonas sp. E05]|uniref:complex I NDUFA9 subunit family protein n=1 Tax=Roseomonas sp. E05 TaxID=3046310 RepID=UPI0024BB74CA|nr:complex I NDUFA9 subunit family protein [Roseomonas sp. E05]MDJ0387025.1 complex I NDUFA9 subunit family protein [Roseomonas sp. E05]
MAIRRLATVFGGTGFIGQHLVPRLARLDYEVRVVTRNPDSVRPLATQGNVGQVKPHFARLGSDPDIAAAVAESCLVVNLIGILSEKRPGDFQRLQGELPGRIGRAAAAGGVARVVHVSAIGADPSSPSAYARSKAAGEVALREAFPAATILRPSIIFGPEDHFFNRFAAMAQWMPFMPVVCGATRFQPVYVADVADALIAAAQRNDSQGRTYELGGPRVVTFRELMAYVLEVTGRHKRLVEMPDGLVRLQAAIGEHLPNPPLTRDQLAQLRRDNVVAPDAAGFAALGLTPKAMEAIVPAYLARFRRGGGRRNRAFAG